MPDELMTPAQDWEICFLGGAAFAIGGGCGMYFVASPPALSNRFT